MLNIVLFGPPGAGKGTQANKLIEKYELNHISTGEIIRQEIKSGSELGKSMEDYIARGELAPDSLVIDMISEYISHNLDCKGNIFDGFPRTTNQAEAFDEILSQYGLKVDAMLSLEVPKAEIIKRLLSRKNELNRSDDGSEQVILNRLDIYDQVTAVVAEFYEKQGKHVGINGMGTVDEIFERLCKEIDKHV